jgi:ABC-2 type transport system permease protein
MSTALAPVSGAHRPGLGRIGLLRTRIELKQFFRDREAAMFSFALPVLLLVIFGSVFSGEIAPGVTFSQYFVAGMIASGTVYTGFQNLAISIPQERDEGTLKRLLGTPMPKSAYFLGKIGLVAVTYVAQVTLLLFVGVLFFKVSLPQTAFQWETFVWLSVVGLTCCTLLGVAFSSLAKNGKGAPALVTPIVLVLQFSSGVFFQYDQLPPWMQQLAALFPLKWLCQGMRAVFLPDNFQAKEVAGMWELPKVAMVLLVWTVLAGILAGTTFRWLRRGER